MLVLSRKKGQTIVIDGTTTVKVYSIRGNTVRLAVDAPKKIPVHRKEVQDQIERGKR